MQKPMRWDVAAGRSKAGATGRRWRAEVGTSVPCVRPRPLRFAYGPGFSFERLVFAEIGDGHSERVDRNQFVGNLGPKNKTEICGEKIALDFRWLAGGEKTNAK